MLHTANRRIILAFCGLLTYVLLFLSPSRYAWIKAETKIPHSATTPTEAYVTFLSSIEDPGYQTAVELLLFQLKQDPLTRDSDPLQRDFVVLTTNRVPPFVEEKLRLGGATIERQRMIKGLPTPAHVAEQENHPYHDQYTKLHVFNMTKYKRLLYLDSDQLLLKPMEGIWDDPNSWPQSGLAGCSDSGQGSDHPVPIPDSDFLNAGLLMIIPSTERFETLLQEKDFDFGLQEQVSNHFLVYQSSARAEQDHRRVC